MKLLYEGRSCVFFTEWDGGILYLEVAGVGVATGISGRERRCRNNNSTDPEVGLVVVPSASKNPPEPDPPHYFSAAFFRITICRQFNEGISYGVCTLTAWLRGKPPSFADYDHRLASCEPPLLGCRLRSWLCWSPVVVVSVRGDSI